jgi:putative hydrolase of the HAD superfamily
MKNKLLDSSLLTIAQAAKLLNVHPDTLRRWERQKKLTSIRVGPRRDRRYRNEDLLAIVSQASIIQGVKKVRKKADSDKIKRVISKAEWVFFDVGYTLMTLFPSRGDVYSDIAYDFGYNLDPKLIATNFKNLETEWDKQKIRSHPLTHASKETVVKHYAQLNSEVLIKSGIPRKEKKVSIEIGTKIFNQIFSNNSLWRVLGDVEEFLKLLKKQGKKLAVVENWDERLPEFMKGWGLDKYFEFIITGGSIKLRKPDPKIFKVALSKIRSKVKPNRIVHVGDRYTEDVLGAREIGITPVLFDRERMHAKNDCLKFYKYQELLK